ncbi:hypothetical protein Tco_1574801 [Tanacetum coccineum]
MDECDSIGTPKATTSKLDANLQGEPIDQTKYQSMIMSLVYLMSSRSDIVFATILCARYQARPTQTYLKEVKQIFWYLKYTYNLGLWYMKDSSFELTVYLDADHAGCLDKCKSTSGGVQLLDDKLTEYQLADLFTKALPKDRFEYLVHQIGMRCLTPTELERLTKSSS